MLCMPAKGGGLGYRVLSVGGCDMAAACGHKGVSVATTRQFTLLVKQLLGSSEGATIRP